jgi:hypothetical protein
MPLERLTVGQHGLRYAADEFHCMMDFVADGGVWNEAALRAHAARHGRGRVSLIQLSEFSAAPGAAGPLLVVHDGHHRLVATHLAGRPFLYAEEYRVTRWTFEQYLEINFACGWVTPYDPRTHVRRADFIAWKQKVLAVALADPARAEQLIRSEAAAYREPRRYGDLHSLAFDCCSLELDRWQERRRRAAAGR